MKVRKCKKCDGNGWVERTFNGKPMQIYCSQCNPNGNRDKYPTVTDPEEKAMLVQRDQEAAERRRNKPVNPYTSAVIGVLMANAIIEGMKESARDKFHR